ncbi:MAG: hypothetical protein QOC87_1903 [Actinomycetota bacterium]|jgi:hypothetical protein|nr:hypothetical protein [Actinomycetota bacterium]
MARGRRLPTALIGIGLMLLVSCQAPARTYPPFEADAVATAQQAKSAVETALLAATTAAKGNAFGNYLSPTLGDAEDTAGAVQGSFDLEQPPDRAADQLRAQLDQILSQANTVLMQLRIHARRGELDRLAEIAQPLTKVSSDLDSFIKAHQ